MKRQSAKTYLSLKLPPDPKLLVRLDHDVKVVQVIDDEAPLLVHGEQYLLHGGVAAPTSDSCLCAPVCSNGTDHVRSTPAARGALATVWESMATHGPLMAFMSYATASGLADSQRG